jgi:hypothetical protein
MMPCTNPTDEAAPVRLALARRADTIADRQTQPCSLFVGEGRGGRWVGWSTNRHGSFGGTKRSGRLLADNSGLTRRTLCDNV